MKKLIITLLILMLLGCSKVPDSNKWAEQEDKRFKEKLEMLDKWHEESMEKVREIGQKNLELQNKLKNIKKKENFIQVWTEKLQKQHLKEKIEAEKYRKSRIAFADKIENELKSNHKIKNSYISNDKWRISFFYKDYSVKIFTQTNGIYGYFHRKTKNQKEEKCIDDMRTGIHLSDFTTKEKEQFKRQFKFNDFVIFGKPIQCIEQLMEMLK